MLAREEPLPDLLEIETTISTPYRASPRPNGERKLLEVIDEHDVGVVLVRL